MKHFFLILIFPFILSFGQDSILIIKGKVIDNDTSEPVVGANVLVLGSINGAATNINGEFTLTIPNGYDEIKISCVGYDEKIIFLIKDCLGPSSDRTIIFKLKQSPFHMSGAFPMYSFNRDSVEIRGRIDALSQLYDNKIILVQTHRITELQKIFENKYNIKFVVNTIHNDCYRIAFNQIILAELVNKYGFIFLEELEVIDWKNQ